MTIKFDRDQHVELFTIAEEALRTPSLLRLAANIAETAQALGLQAGCQYGDLRFFRDMTPEELAEVEARNRSLAARNG